MDIGELKNNYKYYDDAYFPETEVILTVKENAEINIHIEDTYFNDIFGKPLFNGEPWYGFTRDYQEMKGAFSIENVSGVEMSNPQEYLNDMMQYANKDFTFDETKGAFDLIAEFLRYAIATNQTVIVEVQ